MAELFFGPNGTPLFKPEDVIQFLGKQEAHWKEERSAYQVAYSWIDSGGIPEAIQEVLKTDSSFAGTELEKAIFENSTELDKYGRASQTDVLAFLKTAGGKAVLGIEAKVDESFGPLVSEWNDYGTGRLRRLVGLIDQLEFKSINIGSLRYQLLHRTVATLFEARAVNAPEAAMIVQSFDQNKAGFSDFVAFASAFGTPISTSGRLSPPKKLGRVTMRLGWTENPMHLAKS